MPGYVIHLAASTVLISREQITDEKYINEFLLGSIAPDTVPGGDKRLSHFWNDEAFKRLNRMPDLDMFLKEYGHRLKEPYIRGYYSHLYMDYIFVKEYWRKHFQLLDYRLLPEEDYNLVRNIKLMDTGAVYDREEFLSEKLYYGDYDRLNPYITHKYDLRVPVFGEVINGVKELDIVKCKSQLMSLLDKINTYMDSVDSDRREALLVFNLEELYELIERTAEHMLSINK